MGTVDKIIIAILVVLGVASGTSKVMLIEQELGFFHEQLGFAESAIVAFGAVQIASAGLLLTAKTRFAGALLLCIGFALSTALIFVVGDIAFGLVSLLPVILSGHLAGRSFSACKPRGAAGDSPIS